jgi:hypothetical protein
MTNRLRYTCWNLTPDGWKRSSTSEHASEAIRGRPPDTLLAFLRAEREELGDAPPTTAVPYRADDANAIQPALARYGGFPAD